ncbi:MAG TPA: LPD38 domain-containing protein, partial [Candidatus Bathyarchaeia archaeon]|nr:LPD38 domain-containing protein [Candidatus Bathyarchaeia archaeon]
GAAYGQLISTDISRRPDITVAQVLGAHKPMRVVARTLHPVNTLRQVAEVSEMAGRLGSWNAAARHVEKHMPNAPPIVKIVTKARQAQEANVNFARLGDITAYINDAIAFFGPAVASARRLALLTAGVRNVPEFGWDPKAARGTGIKLGYQPNMRRLLRFILAGLGFVAIPTIALWLLNKDNPAYWEIPQRDRDLYWFIPLSDDLFLRVPKPFEIGQIFGAPIERAMQSVYARDPEAFKGVAESMWEVLSPAYVPTAAVPMLEQFGNKSLFWGTPIVPEHLEDADAYLQFRPSTTEIAKVLGEKLNLSPAFMENYVRGWGGTLGIEGLRAADWTLQAAGVIPSKPGEGWTAERIPVLKAFLTRAYEYAKSVQDFYDLSGESAQATASARAVRTDLDDAYKYYGQLSTKWFSPKANAAYVALGNTPEGQQRAVAWAAGKQKERQILLNVTRVALAHLRNERSDLDRDTSVAPETRRQRIMEINRKMAVIAREAVKKDKAWRETAEMWPQ